MVLINCRCRSYARWWASSLPLSRPVTDGSSARRERMVRGGARKDGRQEGRRCHRHLVNRQLAIGPVYLIESATRSDFTIRG